MRFYTIAMSTVAAMGLNTAATPALAQAGAQSTTAEPTAPEATARQDGDIIVTATRQETLLQNTPVAITALSAKTLEQRGVTSLLDIGNYVPNLSVGGRGSTGANQGSVAIRGMGEDAPDSAPSVGIYIDEVYYPSATGNLLGLFDVARVEVLRGPQGTLFGRNTIAGAIQYVSVKPNVDKFSGFAFGSVSTLDSHELSGALNLPLSSTLAVRVSGQFQQQGGYVHDRLNDVDRGQTRSEQGRIQLRWQPSSNLTIDVKAETTKLSGNGRPVVATAFNPSLATVYQVATGIIPSLPPVLRETRSFMPGYLTPRGSYSIAGFNAPDYLMLRYNAGNGTIAYDISDDIRLKSISAYSFTRSHFQNDFDATPLSILATDRGTQRTRLFTQELQLTGHSFSKLLDWTAGLYYFNTSNKSTNQTSTIALLPARVVPENSLRNRSFAAYGQLTANFGKGLSATGGLRYSRETVRGTYTANNFPPIQQRFVDTSPYVGLNWQIDPNALIYAKASKGFRAGGFKLDPGLIGGSLYFRPETAWTYEAGARLQFLDHRLRFNPTIFQTDWDDIQFVYVSLPSGSPIAGTRNAGDARLRGIELETQLAVMPDFQLTGAFSYLDARYTRLSPPVPGSIPTILTLSDPLPRSPKFKASIGGRYSLNIGASRLVANLDYAFTSKQRSSTDGDQAVTMPQYGLLNGRLEFTPTGVPLSLAVYGTNLTNKYYLIDGVNFRSNTGFTLNTPGRKREIGVSARLTF